MNQEQELLEILNYYSQKPNPSQQDNIVAMLREIQDLLGCVPKGVQEQAAKAVGTKPAVIHLLVQRFPSLQSAAYEHRLTVCTGQRCGSQNSYEVISTLRKELAVDKEGFSQDGTVLFCTQNCLKQCGKGPNLLLDGVLYSAMNVQKAKELVKTLKTMSLEK